VGESGVGKTTMCLKAIEELKRPYFTMSQSDDELWAQVLGSHCLFAKVTIIES
jgi:molybdopterin-guanine dinucleotide biosynthesis protein